jgi:hypothetical protein
MARVIEGAPLPAGDKPLNKLFPETVEQILKEGGKSGNGK